jgi:hypothetical protein
VRDPELFLARLWAMEDELVRAGLEPMPEWWRVELSRFYRSGRRRWVVRKGRRVFASTCVAPRLAVAEALFGEHQHIPGSPPLEYAFLSIKVGEAANRLVGVDAALNALGLQFTPRGQTIRLRGLPALFNVVTASHKTNVGGTIAFAWLDEVARWSDNELGANPAELVVSSLAPALATLPNAKMILVSSPLGEDDYHAREFDRGETEQQCVSFGETWTVNPTLTKEDTRAMEPDHDTWLREYAAIPSKGVKNNWFGEAVDAALTDDPPPAIGSGQRPVIAIDPAFAHDYFGWCVILSEQSDHVDAVTGRRYRRTWVQQAGAWKPEGTPRETLRRLWREIALPAWRASGQDGMPRVVSDQFEGFSLTELARDVGIALEVVPWTGGSGENAKLTKFKAVRTAMRESAFLVPREHPVVKEFRSVRGVLTQSGLERIEYARTGEGHLDMLSAVVLGGSVALERMPRAVDPVPVVLDEGARMRAERIREVEKRQKQQWDRDPRHAMRAAMRR